jgi:multidrug efflux system outer membrane protein
MRGDRFFLFAVAGILAGGCTLAPRYDRPEPPVPGQWPSGAAYKETMGRDPAELKWQEFVADSRLRDTVERALNNNRDLRLAALNVQRARAIYGIRRAELAPSVIAAGTGDRHRLPADLSPTGKAITTEQYSVELGIASWEIDFFGRIQSLKDQALEEYFATEQARRSAQISLVSAVANAYLTLVADRENLRLAMSTLETQKGIRGLILKRYEIGLASEIELRQAETQVEAARGEVARFTQLVAQDENALNLLVGAKVPAELLAESLGDITPPSQVSAGISSEVLLRRPDIMAAEHRLRAANAFIGAARAAFFPRISLTSVLGTASGELTGLFKGGSRAWSFVPQIVLPIFDARTWSAYEASKVEREVAVAQYEKAIQTAFREVADALAVQGTVEEQLSAQQSLVKALAETHRLARLRYERGIDTYLTVLDSQRALFAAEQGLVTVRLLSLTNRVRLFAVLGGGTD